PSLDDRSWKKGEAPFGTPVGPVRTRWESPVIWLRTHVDLPRLSPDDRLLLYLRHDEDADVLVNGSLLCNAPGYANPYQESLLTPAQRALFHTGSNLIAVRCRNASGPGGIDVGLKLLRPR